MGRCSQVDGRAREIGSISNPRSADFDLSPGSLLSLGSEFQTPHRKESHIGEHLKLHEILREQQLPDGGRLTLRPATGEDAQFLLAVYESTRADELAQVEWPPGQRDVFIKWQFETQRREYDTRFPDAEYDVILIDNQPAGRIWIGRDNTQVRLLDIALLPEFQNRKAGTTLIRRLMTVAKSGNIPLRHMVFVLNDDAHRFYERMGFVIIEDLGAYKHMEYNPV